MSKRNESDIAKSRENGKQAVTSELSSIGKRYRRRVTLIPLLIGICMGMIALSPLFLFSRWENPVIVIGIFSVGLLIPLEKQIEITFRTEKSPEEVYLELTGSATPFALPHVFTFDSMTEREDVLEFTNSAGDTEMVFEIQSQDQQSVHYKIEIERNVFWFINQSVTDTVDITIEQGGDATRVHAEHRLVGLRYTHIFESFMLSRLELSAFEAAGYAFETGSGKYGLALQRLNFK